MHEEFLRRMRDLSRQRLDMEDRLLGREEAESGGMADICSVLLVNDDPDAGTQLAAVFPEDKGWQVTLAQTGGESLDLAHQLRPQIVVVKDPLPRPTGPDRGQFREDQRPRRRGHPLSAARTKRWGG